MPSQVCGPAQAPVPIGWDDSTGHQCGTPTDSAWSVYHVTDAAVPSQASQGLSSARMCVAPAHTSA